MSIISICVTRTFQGLQEIAFSLVMSLFFDEKWREMERGKREHDIDELVSAIRIGLRCVDVLYSRCYPVWPWYGQKSPHHTKFAQRARTLLQTQQRVRPTSCGAGDQLTEVDHDAWRLKRAMLEPEFHRKYLMNSMEAFNSICGDFLQNLRKYADGKTPVRMVDEFARVILDIIGKVLTVGIMIIYAFGGLSWLAEFKLRVFDMWCFFVH